MNTAAQFKTFLQKHSDFSPSSIKNYIADLNHFIAWYEKSKGSSFHPAQVTLEDLTRFREEKSNALSEASLKRHLSSLKKYFQYSKVEGLISQSPLDEQTTKLKPDQDPFMLKDFKNFLYVYNASPLTIKNYVIDVKQFLSWLSTLHPAETQNMNLFDKVSSELIDEYKTRLMANANFSPSSVNRKLSSLRRYFSWANEQGLIKHYVAPDLTQRAIKMPTKHVTPPAPPELKAPGILDKALGIPLGIFDEIITVPVAYGVSKAKFFAWKLRGKPVFKHTKKDITPKFAALKHGLKVSNVKKEFYAPSKMSIRSFPIHKKIAFHVRHTRPNWYRKHQNAPLAIYFQYAVVIIMIAALGFGFYNAFVNKPSTQKGVLAAPTSPPRILSFQGRLTDNSDNPITSTSHLRVQIYDDLSATGAGNLLWQEVDTVSPDSDGIFSILLGNGSSCAGQPLAIQQSPCAIPASVFTDNSTLYLGIAIGTSAELSPRQQIATVAFASNSESLQGLVPTTQAGLTSYTNTVLALDGTTSSPTLTIGGSVGATFQATGGEFIISGKPLTLTTQTNGNITLNPDGLGKIDLQKPLQNNTNTGNVATARGAVEINDEFAVLATSSGRSAVTINQDGAGPVLSASASGSERFTVANNGNVTIAGTTVNLGGGSAATIGTVSDDNLSIIPNGTGDLNLATTNTGDVSIGNGTGTIALTLGSDATGDLYYRNSGGTLSRLGVGASGSVLTSSGTIPSWASSSGTGAIGYWTRTGTVFSPTNAGDSLSIVATATTGNVNVFSDSSLAVAAGATGNLLNLTFTNNSINSSGNSITTGLNIAGTNSAAGAGGTMENYAIRIQDLAGTPGAGTQNNYGIRIGNQGQTNAETSYGLYVDTQSGSATANYAAIFAGGNVGVGDTSPIALFTVGTSDAFQVDSSGNITTSGNAAINGGSLTTTASTFNLVNTTATTVNFAGGATTSLVLGSSTASTVNIPSLTASRFLLTDSSKNLVSSGASSVLSNTLTDETGTGGVAVFNTSPEITTSITTGSTTFSLVNTTATTVNFAGAATTLNVGAASGTITLGSNSTLNGGSAANDDITIQGTSNGTRTTSYVNLQPNGGNVGIGTTAPEALLEIQGAESTDAVLALDADDGDEDADTWFIKSLAGDNSLSLLNHTTEVANLSSAGNLQIDGDLTISGGNITNAITLDSTLAVIGITNLTGNLNANGGLDVDDAFVIADGGVLTTSQNANFDVGFDVDDAFQVADGGALTTSQTATFNGTLDANGVVTLGDGGDTVTLDGTTLTLQNTGAGNDIVINAVDQITLSDFITDANAVLYTDTSGNIKRVAETETGSQCLISGAGASGIPTWGSCGGGSQSPWTSDIDADGFDLNDLSNILFRETTGAPTGSDVAIFRDNSGDLNLNVLTGKTLNLQVNGTDEYNFSSSGLNANDNLIENIGASGTDFTAGGGLTLAELLTVNDDVDLVFAAAENLNIDATTIDSTTTGGVIDLNVSSVTDGNRGLNLDYTFEDAAGNSSAYAGRINMTVDTDASQSHTAYGLYISGDNDDASSTLYGLYVDADSDGGGEGTEYAAGFKGHVVPTADNTYDLGTASLRWANVYATNLIATATEIAGTISDTFTINTDNATADGEPSSLAFERGSTSPNALISWDNSNDEFDFNFGVNITGGLTVSGLTASRGVFTTTGGLLTTSGTSQYLVDSLSDETGSVGGGVAVFNVSPSISTSITTGSTSFDLVNTTATTVFFGGAATAINAGASNVALTLGSNATINGGASANDDLTISGTSNGTKTTSYVVLQPGGGNVGIATTAPDSLFDVNLGTAGNFQLTYNDSNGSATTYSRFGIDSSGNLSIDNTGTKTIIADDLQITGDDLLDSSATTRVTLGATTTLTNTTTTLSGTSTLTASSLATFTTAATLGMTSTTTLNLGNNATVSSNATALNIEEDGGVDINLGGTSAGTGCTITNSTGALSCAGAITSTATTGTQGWWTRTGTTLSPANAGDAVTTSGNISTTSTGTITSAGTLTASNGLTLTTGALSLTGTSGSIALTGFGTTSITSTTTTGNINTFADSSLAVAAAATGNLMNLTYTNNSVNTSGTAITTGLNIAGTNSAAGSGGTMETYGIRIQDIAGTPAAGTQNNYGIRIGNQGQSGAETSYGLYVDSQSGSATANYAAVFAGGNVGIGTTTPSNNLTVALSSTDTPVTGGLDGIGILNTDTSASSSQGIIFQAYDSGSTGRHGAAIQFAKEAIWTNGVNYPGYLSFWTRPPDGTGNEYERFRLGSIGEATFTSDASSKSLLAVNTGGNATMVQVSAPNFNMVAQNNFESSDTESWGKVGATPGNITLTSASSDVTTAFGSTTLKVAITGTESGDGTKYSVALAATTTYSLSFYAQTSAGTVSNIEVGRSDDGSTDTSCLTSQSFTTTQTRFTCTFTTGSVSGTRYIYVKKVNTTAGTFYLDGVLLEKATSSSTYQQHPVNIVTNGGAETDSTGWSAKGSTTLTGGSKDVPAFAGNSTLKAATTTTANDGVKFNLTTLTLASTTNYALSFWARTASGSISDLIAGRADDGTTFTNCTLSSTSVTTSWNRYTCTFTTGTTSGTPNVFIGKSGGTAETFYIDGVKLEVGSSITPYSEGGFQLAGVLSSIGGRVGITNQAPAYKLDVTSFNNTVDGVNITNLSSGTTAQSRLQLLNDRNSAAANAGFLTTYSSGYTAAAFGITLADYTLLASQGTSNNGLIIGSLTADPVIFGTNNSERMRIDSSGNVGIGTTNPDRRLYVSGGDTAGAPADASNKASTLLLSSTSGAANNGGTLEFGFGAGTFTQPYFAAIKGLGSNGSNNTQGHLAFYTRPTATDSTLTEAMRIVASGSVGIGSTSPDGLQINSAVTETADSSDNVRLGVAGGTPRIIFEDNGSTQWEIDNSAATLRFYQPGTTYMSLTSTALTLVGDLAVNGDDITSDGDLTIDAAGGQVTLPSTSDAVLATALSGALILGSTGSTNTVFDNNEIMARNNGATSTLNIQAEGGSTDFNGSVIISVGGEALTFDNGTSNRIVFPNVGSAAPAFTSYSAGVREVFWDSISASNAGYAQGIESNHMWFGTALNGTGAAASTGFKWYGGTTLLGSMVFNASNETTFGLNTATPDDFFEIEGDLGGVGILLDSSSGAGIQLDRGATSNTYQVRMLTAGVEKWVIGNKGESNESLYFYDTAAASGNAEISFNTAGDITLAGQAFIQGGYEVVTEDADLWYIGSNNLLPAANDCSVASTGAYCWNKDDSAEGEMSLGSTGNFRTRGTQTASVTPDYAEYIDVIDQSIESGDIVSSLTYDAQASNKYQKAVASKSNAAYQPSIIGAISEDPSFIVSSGFSVPENEMGQALNADERALTVAGRIMVKVSSVNGTIKTGDAITSSSTPGVGMKATKAGHILGIAMEDYNNSNPNSVNKILVFINPSWHDPDVYITDAGNVSIAESNPSNFEVRYANGAQSTRIGVFAESVIGKVRAGLVQAKKVSTDSLDVASEQVTIAGKQLSQYISDIVDQRLAQNQTASLSPEAKVNSIEPKDTDKLAIKLKDNEGVSKLEVQNASGSAVASIDSKGRLTAEEIASKHLTVDGDLEVKGDATVSGVLRAQKIIADQIEGLTISSATISATYITNNYYGASQSASASPSGELAASQSANLISGSAIFENGLMAFGPSSLSDLTLTGQLAVGTQLVLADNTVNVLGGNLEIQPLRQGNVSFMDDLVSIDTQGNLAVRGNANFSRDVSIQGLLTANEIAPFNNGHLVVKLGGNEASESGKLIVKNASGSAVLSIDSLGNLTASGAAQFAKLNLETSLASPSSKTRAIATGSAGMAIIQEGQTRITITNTSVTENSLIYVTPRADTIYSGQPYIEQQTAYDPENEVEGSFTVKINRSISADMPFNWVIIN